MKLVPLSTILQLLTHLWIRWQKNWYKKVWRLLLQSITTASRLTKQELQNHQQENSHKTPLTYLHNPLHLQQLLLLLHQQLHLHFHYNDCHKLMYFLMNQNMMHNDITFQCPPASAELQRWSPHRHISPEILPTPPTSNVCLQQMINQVTLLWLWSKYKISPWTSFF